MHGQGKQADSRAGDVLLSYAAPSKHQGQGVHRYVVAVLEQPEGKRLMAAPPKHRSHFKVQVGQILLSSVEDDEWVMLASVCVTWIHIHTCAQEFAKVHGLNFVGASCLLGDWQTKPPAQRKRA